ncbi:MAG: hypothetical protein RLN81_07450 [Balneolaceae bacterium]
MPNQILLDNWTLQEISQLNQLGLSTTEADKIVINKEKDSHIFEEIPHGFVQIQALFTFLQNIILRDTIILDDGFTYVWEHDSFLQKIESEGLLKTHPFQEEKYSDVRKAVVDELCVTSSIRSIQELNEKEWELYGRSYNNYMSALIWGGAGMLARAQIYDIFYQGHPLREYAFTQSRITNRDAFSETMSFISTQKTKLLYFDDENTNAIQVRFSLPPFISTVIEESNDFHELFITALQMRENYKDLREWIKKFQLALDSENSDSIVKHMNTLKSVQEFIEKKYSPDKFGKLELSFDVLNLSPSISITAPINAVKNKLGVRSTINKLILNKPGRSSVKKLLKMLDEENSKLGTRVYTEIITRYSS